MGLTNSSSGASVRKTDERAKTGENTRLIALAGNPNVGKSTLFNALTGMRQHTGNWPGKTVGSACGKTVIGGEEYIVADIPGAYSLLSRSAEEDVARDLLLFGEAHLVLAVCDATCLQRSLNLALQILEVRGDVIVCVNLLDEAEHRGILVNVEALSHELGVPVVGMSAGRGRGVAALREAVRTHAETPRRSPVPVSGKLSRAIAPAAAYFAEHTNSLPPEWLAMRFLEGEASMVASLERNLKLSAEDPALARALSRSRENLQKLGLDAQGLSDRNAQALGDAAERVCARAVSHEREHGRAHALDLLLTHKILGWPVMALLLAGILWLTVSGANLPSELLSRALFSLGEVFRMGLTALSAPEALVSLLVDGVWKTAAWVVSVMLPPMAIFFPLFTLLEDWGFLPRVAFNLDGFFKRCGACGKQGLTM